VCRLGVDCSLLPASQVVRLKTAPQIFFLRLIAIPLNLRNFDRLLKIVGYVLQVNFIQIQ